MQRRLLIFFQVEETTKYTVTERPGGRDVGVLMGPLIPPWRGKMCWLSAGSSEAEFPYACLWMQWILTSPNLQYAERDRWVLGIPGHLQRCQISSYCGDRYVGSAHICFASTVWCSPPPIPGKLKHLMPTLAFRKGKQVPSDHCLLFYRVYSCDP